MGWSPLPTLVGELRRRAAAFGEDIGSLYGALLRGAEEAAVALVESCEVLGCRALVEGFEREARILVERVTADPYSAYDSVKDFAGRLSRAATVARHYRAAYITLAAGGSLAVLVSSLAAIGGLGAHTLLLLAGAALAMAAALLSSYRSSPPLAALSAALAALAGPPLPYLALIAGGGATALAALLYRRLPSRLSASPSAAFRASS